MAMSFERSLEAICKEILPSAEEFLSYNEDAEKIQNHIIEEMKKADSTFETAFNGITCVDRNRWCADLPDEHDFYIKLKMPFNIQPVEDGEISGIININAACASCLHSLVRDNLLSRLCLQDWIRCILKAVIRDRLRLRFNDRLYYIEYPVYGRGYDVAHTILAKEIRYRKRKITFDLIPAFEFQSFQWPLKQKCFLDTSSSTWFAVPFGNKLQNGHNSARPDEFSFMDCQYKWEQNAWIYGKENLKNSLRLMKSIRDAKNLDLLTNYMLKRIYLDEIKIQPQEFWDQPTGILLIKMFEELEHALRHHKLLFFHDKRFKNLDQLRKELFQFYPIQLKMIIKNCKHFQKQSKINYADIAAFSYARSACGSSQKPFLK